LGAAIMGASLWLNHWWLQRRKVAAA